MQAPRAGIWRPEAILALQRTAGNQATGRLLRDKAPAAGGGELVKRMGAVSERASSRAHALAGAQGDAIRVVQQASKHLDDVTTGYGGAWSEFDATIRKAKEEYEAHLKVRAMVEGVVIGSLMGMIGTEMLALDLVKGFVTPYKEFAGEVRFFTQGLPRFEQSWFGAEMVSDARLGLTMVEETVLRKVVEQSSGEIRDAGVAQVLEAVHGDPDAIAGEAGAGASRGEAYEEAFHRLVTLVEALPNEVDLVAAQYELALCARDLLAGASSPRAEAVAEIVLFADMAGELFVRLTEAMFDRLHKLAARILAIPTRTAEEVERDLWTNWLARLDHDQDDLIDTVVIRRKLHAMGFDAHMKRPLALDTRNLTINETYQRLDGVDDDEQREVVAEAQRRWLQEHRPGLVVPEGAAAIDSRFRGEQLIETLRGDLIGRAGVITAAGEEVTPGNWTGERRVKVGGHELYVGPPAAGRQPGRRVLVKDVQVKPSLAGAGVNDTWDESMLEAVVEDL